MRGFLIKWFPVYVWAALIFFFSTETFSSPETYKAIHRLLAWIWPGLTPEVPESVNQVARKLGHWGEYFLFAVLLSRALQPEPTRPWDWRRASWTALVIFLYACSDELHQAFVPGRTASFVDVLLDFFGSVCGTLWLYFWRRFRWHTRR